MAKMSNEDIMKELERTSERSRAFAEAVENMDILTMVLVYQEELLNGLRTLSCCVDDPEAEDAILDVMLAVRYECERGRADAMRNASAGL